MDVWLGMYFGDDPTKDAMPLQMYKDGYDVYLSLSRGTGESREKEGCEY